MVVGTRGVLDKTGIQQAMTFLSTEAAASVEALVCMHSVQKSGAPSRGNIKVVGED